MIVDWWRDARPTVGEELAGLDALELADRDRPSLPRRVWIGDVAEARCHRASRSASWQLVVWSGWRPEYVLPGPGEVFAEFATNSPTGGCSERCG